MLRDVILRIQLCIAQITEFLDLMNAACSGDEHWALKIGLRYYMAQCPIISNEPPGVPPVLAFLASELPEVPLASGQELAQVASHGSFDCCDSHPYY